MSHPAQRQFFEAIYRRFPSAFESKKALDCGSLDVNGSLRDLFWDCRYTGVDQRPGKNVDVVGLIHHLQRTYRPQSFDTIVSAEMLEHDEFWVKSLDAMVVLLKPEGLLALSMAGEGREEHGTLSAPDLGEVPADGIWGTSPDYYMNLMPDDLLCVLMPDKTFTRWAVERNTVSHDLYFWGIKK